MTPIEHWIRLTQSDLPVEEVADALRDLYRQYAPRAGALLFTAHCPFTCQHCIFPYDYHQLNRDLDQTKWLSIVKDLFHGLGIRVFIHNGRSLNRKILDILFSIREQFPSVKLGMILDGDECLRHVKALTRLAPDWIDISVDGHGEAHDMQRQRPGSYRTVLQAFEVLLHSGIDTTLNALTCLTALNRHSVQNMVEDLYLAGVRNFFLSSVSIVEQARPSPSLALDRSDMPDLVLKSHDMLSVMDDAQISFDFYEGYDRFIDCCDQLELDPVGEGDWLSGAVSSGTSRLSLYYHPLSLNGLREFIVNSDGTVILPKVIAYGTIPEKAKIGLLPEETARDLFQTMPHLPAFKMFTEAICEEREMVKRIKNTRSLVW